jgi:uncharacterized protein YukE
VVIAMAGIVLNGDVPSNYDTATLSIDPAALSQAVTAINAAAQEIVDGIVVIQLALSSLQLSWTGASATVADEFQIRLTSAMTALYGSEVNQNDGAINALTGGVGLAAKNYAANEQAVVTMFNGFTKAMGGGGVAGSGSSGLDPSTVFSADPSDAAPASTTDQVSGTFHSTAVDEEFYGTNGSATS